MSPPLSRIASDERLPAQVDVVVIGGGVIGVSAAYGIALGVKNFVGTSLADLEDDLEFMSDVLAKTRPTAVNLFWAIERMRETFNRAKSNKLGVAEIKQALIDDAHLANGLNVYEGAIAHEAVAKDLGKAFKRPNWLS